MCDCHGAYFPKNLNTLPVEIQFSPAPIDCCKTCNYLLSRYNGVGGWYMGYWLDNVAKSPLPTGSYKGMFYYEGLLFKNIKIIKNQYFRRP